ncbi:uncharacterized protein LOC124166980 [Ischnura elegans]|uniref:uncharacterized protein LOC124166980 n=1 Tax=Ischnura elegans TaxID=197161 RepID=UPI001ED8B353|nr:uncharacterized protein LOC124166980 [Ischnura elegans]
MCYLKQFPILSACLVAFGISSSTAFPPTSMSLDECREALKGPKNIFADSFKAALLDEAKINVSKKMYNESRCGWCQHFCRETEILLNIMGAYFDSIMNITNRSKVIVPFLRIMVEEGLQFLCDNYAEAYTAYFFAHQELYFMESYEICRHLLPEDVGTWYCDTETPDDDHAIQFICEGFVGAFECMEKNITTEDSTLEGKTFLSSASQRIKNTKFCSEFF